MSSCIRRVPSLDAFERSIELVTFMSGTNNICIFNVKTGKSEKKFGR